MLRIIKALAGRIANRRIADCMVRTIATQPIIDVLVKKKDIYTSISVRSSLRTKSQTCAAHVRYFDVSTCTDADTRHSGAAERVQYTTCTLLRQLYFGLSDAPRSLYESLDALSQRPFVRTTIPRIRKIGDCYDYCRSRWREHNGASRLSGEKGIEERPCSSS